MVVGATKDMVAGECCQLLTVVCVRVVARVDGWSRGGDHLDQQR